MEPRRIRLLDIQEAKRLAKQSRAGSGLSHTQALDEIARRHFGLRHYHELQTLSQKNLERHYVRMNDEGLTRCKYCGLRLFVLPDDKGRHEEQHLAYEKAEQDLGFLPLEYALRERLKEHAYTMLDPDSVDEHELGTLLLLVAYFDRSLDSAILNGRLQHHPGFAEYIPHALRDITHVPDGVKASLYRKHGRVDEPLAADTYWKGTKSDLKKSRNDGSDLRAGLLKGLAL